MWSQSFPHICQRRIPRRKRGGPKMQIGNVLMFYSVLSWNSWWEELLQGEGYKEAIFPSCQWGWSSWLYQLNTTTTAQVHAELLSPPSISPWHMVSTLSLPVFAWRKAKLCKAKESRNATSLLMIDLLSSVQCTLTSGTQRPTLWFPLFLILSLMRLVALFIYFSSALGWWSKAKQS